MSDNGGNKKGGGGGGKPTEKSHILNTSASSTTTTGNTTRSGPARHNQQVTSTGSSGKPQQKTTTAAGPKKGNAGKNAVTSLQNPSRPTGKKGKSPGNQFPEDGLSPTSPVSPASITNENDMSQLVHQMDMEESEHKSSIAHASYNYINSILGSGVIGMPYAIHQAGLFAGLALMALVAVITDYSLIIMVRAGHLAGSFTYQGIMESAFGRPGFYILSVIQFMYPVIAMISYNIIVGDTLTKVLIYFSTTKDENSEELEFQRESVVLLATIFVTLPLSLYRNVARLSKVSFLSLVSIGIILLAIIVRLGTMHITPTLDSWSVIRPSGVIPAIGVFAFAFMCHHNTFMLYGSLKNSTEQKWKTVTHISVGTSLMVSLVFSLVGYATFTGQVQGDLLENYCWNDDLMNMARTLFCITILLTFPLECFVARDVIENVFFSGKQPPTNTRHFGVTLLIVLLCYVISISTDCLGVVLELNGILAAMPLAYILPALCFIRLDPSPFLSKHKIPAIATAIFGSLVSLTGLIILLVNGPSTEHCSHGQQMPYCTKNPIINSLLNSTTIQAEALRGLDFHNSTKFIESLPIPIK